MDGIAVSSTVPTFSLSKTVHLCIWVWCTLAKCLDKPLVFPPLLANTLLHLRQRALSLSTRVKYSHTFDRFVLSAMFLSTPSTLSDPLALCCCNRSQLVLLVCECVHARVRRCYTPPPLQHRHTDCDTDSVSPPPKQAIGSDLFSRSNSRKHMIW